MNLLELHRQKYQPLVDRIKEDYIPSTVVLDAEMQPYFQKDSPISGAAENLNIESPITNGLWKDVDEEEKKGNNLTAGMVYRFTPSSSYPTLRIRQNPNKDAELRAILRRQTFFVVTEEAISTAGKWWKISRGFTGWVLIDDDAIEAGILARIYSLKRLVRSSCYIFLLNIFLIEQKIRRLERKQLFLLEW